jgi:hypothetical protein
MMQSDFRRLEFFSTFVNFNLCVAHFFLISQGEKLFSAAVLISKIIPNPFRIGFGATQRFASDAVSPKGKTAADANALVASVATDAKTNATDAKRMRLKI